MTEVRADITASVWKVNVEVGQQVAANDELVVLESMKMEIPVVAPIAGTVSAVLVAAQDQVAEGAVLVTLA
ncbi:MAG: biotin/lipoyl-binding carrier protein [Acidimicrobiales bacterium]